MTDHTDATDSVVCAHLDRVQPVEPGSAGCEECLAIGSTWVHLRMCLTCGRVGCCNESPMKHSTRHWRAEGHPIMRSIEPGEDWTWCFVDRIYLDAVKA